MNFFRTLLLILISILIYFISVQAYSIEFRNRIISASRPVYIKDILRLDSAQNDELLWPDNAVGWISKETASEILRKLKIDVPTNSWSKYGVAWIEICENDKYSEWFTKAKIQISKHLHKNNAKLMHAYLAPEVKTGCLSGEINQLEILEVEFLKNSNVKVIVEATPLVGQRFKKKYLIRYEATSNCAYLKSSLKSQYNLSNDDVYFKPCEWNENIIGDKDDLSGYKIRRNIREGTLLKREMISYVNDIEKSDRVLISVFGKGILLQLDGNALSSGNIGDYILIRSEASSSVLEAKVIDKGKVALYD